MADFLHRHTPVWCEGADGEMVRKGARGHVNRAFFLQQRRERLLQFLNHSSDGVRVGCDVPFLHQAPQQLRVLAGRERQAIRCELHVG